MSEPGSTPSPETGRERQAEVYVGGAHGEAPRVPVSFERLERAAQSAMSRKAYTWVARGAGAEETIRANRTGGEEGVREVMPSLRADSGLALGLVGCGSVVQVGRDPLADGG